MAEGDLPIVTTRAPVIITEDDSGAASVWEQSLTTQVFVSSAAITYVTSKILWAYIRGIQRKVAQSTQLEENIREAELVDELDIEQGTQKASDKFQATYEDAVEVTGDTGVQPSDMK